MSKTFAGNFFEDFKVGQRIRHATPRTVSAGDVSIYTALYGSRFAVQSSDEFARRIGFERSPIDDLLTFHLVFGKTVPDVSLNAVANLGYADCRFLRPVFPKDTLHAESEIIGLRQNSNGKSGIVYVRSAGYNQNGDCVLEFIRWVMVKKQNLEAPSPEEVVPDLPKSVEIPRLVIEFPEVKADKFDLTLSGSRYLWDDYEEGEVIDHQDGVTIEEAEHQMATRLYQNTARVHFNDFDQKSSRHGRRLVYGGHIISLSRAMSFNGLGNAFHLCAINSGQHLNPCFAGDTVFAWSKILQKERLPHRTDLAVLRLRTCAVKDHHYSEFAKVSQSEDHLLDIDYWVALPAGT